MSDSGPLDRREFARRGLLGGVAILGMREATAAPPDRAEPPAAADNPVNAPPEPALPTEEALLLTYLVQHYPSPHYRDEGVLQGIYGDIAGDLSRGRSLSRYPLTNADEPGPIFQAWRSDLGEVLGG